MPVTTEAKSPQVAALVDLAHHAMRHGPQFFKAMRDAAIGRFRDMGFPTTRHEDWRFTNLGALASRVSGPFGAEIQGLEAALYGPAAREWRGEALRRALEALPRQAGQPAGDEPDPLAPLYR